MADIPPLPASATGTEQTAWLKANGIMVELTDPLGRKYLMPEAVDNVGVPVPPAPVNIKAPTLSSILPTTASVASLVNLRCLGRFTFMSGILVNGVPVPTTYVSDTELMATIPGSTQTAGAKPITVADGEVASAPKTLTYT